MEFYFKYCPNPPAVLEGDVCGFFNRTVVDLKQYKAKAIVTQAADLPIGSTLPFIIDIDIFRENVDGIADLELWSFLEQLRELKNRVFFDCITDEAERLFR